MDMRAMLLNPDTFALLLANGRDVSDVIPREEEGLTSLIHSDEHTALVIDEIANSLPSEDAEPKLTQEVIDFLTEEKAFIPYEEQESEASSASMDLGNPEPSEPQSSLPLPIECVDIICTYLDCKDRLSLALVDDRVQPFAAVGTGVCCGLECSASHDAVVFYRALNSRYTCGLQVRTQLNPAMSWSLLRARDLGNDPCANSATQFALRAYRTRKRSVRAFVHEYYHRLKCIYSPPFTGRGPDLRCRGIRRLAT
jgi:hypothetical protein